MPKTVPASKFQEWKALDRINPIVHAMRCIFREITKDDFGIDGEIEIVLPKADGTGYQTSGGVLKVQAKSGMTYVKEDTDSSFSSPVSEDDLELWYKATYPTLYIVYHPADEKLYWKEVRSYAKATPKVFLPPLRIVFDKATDEFTPDCFDQLCGLANISPPRISMHEQEKLYSNLLSIKRMPFLWSAPTKAHEAYEIRHAMQDAPPLDVCAGRLYTLANLTYVGSPMRDWCDISQIRKEDLSTWSDDDARRDIYVHLLKQLLAMHLSHCGIRYVRRFKRDYFPRRDQDQLEFRQPWFNVRTKRQAPQRLTAKYYTYGLDAFWRHLAAHLSFRYIGGGWYLQIIPKYFFTSDGFTPYDRDKVGPYTTQIKAMETNQHVLNHVLFWADAMDPSGISGESSSEIKIILQSRTVMIIDKLPSFGVTDFAIPFDPAIFEEPEPSGQLGFDWLGGRDDESDVAEGEDEDAN